MLEKWISLLEESGVPWDLKMIPPQHDLAPPTISLLIIANGGPQYELLFEYDCGGVALVRCGVPNG